MRILGIDPGYAISGYGIVDRDGNKFSPVEYGAIKTGKDLAMPERLKCLYLELTTLIERFRPEEASVEQLFFNTNAKTAIFVSQARGVAILACANMGLDIYEYTPLAIKTSLTGYGKADKTQMQSVVQRILGLSEIPKPDDAADALAAAVCHGFSANAVKRINAMK